MGESTVVPELDIQNISEGGERERERTGEQEGYRKRDLVEYRPVLAFPLRLRKPLCQHGEAWCGFPSLVQLGAFQEN